MRAKTAFISGILILISHLNFSCKKSSNPKAPAIIKEQPEVTKPEVTKSLLPATLEVDKIIVTLKYASSNEFLTELESTDGTRELYLYTDKNLPKEYDRYIKGEKKYAVYYIRNDAGLVIQANQNKVESGGSLLTPTGTYKIEYNAASQISKVTWYDNNNKQLRQLTRTYNLVGDQVSKIEETGQVVAFTYDVMNGWCKNIKLTQLLSIESMNNLLLSSAGNITKSTWSGTKTGEAAANFTYNTDKYPTSWIEKDTKGLNHNYKIAYK
jgi:hypothetical protein